jgi:hypothetical protein
VDLDGEEDVQGVACLLLGGFRYSCFLLAPALCSSFLFRLGKMTCHPLVRQLYSIRVSSQVPSAEIGTDA